jgi:Zn-dependent protease
MNINVILAFMIIVCFLLAIVIHEYAHALTASLLGDSTPRTQGRQSLSLRAHIDPLGLLVCIVLAFYPVAMGPIGLGWGKPVKTDAWKLRGGPNVGTLIVSLAGIVTSLGIGLIVAALMRFLPGALYANPVVQRIPQFITVFAITNLVLGFLNILPIYPLDGYQILYTLLPSRQALKFAKSAQFGPLIIICLIFVLPFLGEITGISGFFLFQLPEYLLLGVQNLVALVSGLPLYDIQILYPLL